MAADWYRWCSQPMDALRKALTTPWRALPILALALALASGYANGNSAESFDAFLAALWPDAAAQGITRATFDAAFAGATPDPQ